MIIRTVEEPARFQPSVQLITWPTALQDIDIAGAVIPPEASVTLAVAAGNRDPEQFDDPDVFDPQREGEHLGFGGGIHFCFGAALARLEAQIALIESRSASRTPDSSPIRLPTGRARSCAVRCTCWSTSTKSPRRCDQSTDVRPMMSSAERAAASCPNPDAVGAQRLRSAGTGPPA